MKHETEILKIKGDWADVVDDCRATVGKESLGKEPSKKFKREILIAEHSPIRNIHIKWKWPNIKSWVATHWVRHKWECYVKSQRNDRQNEYDRNKAPQDAPVTFTGEANPQHLIDTWRRRLCFQASTETREYAEDFKEALHETEPEIADVLVPNCVYRCGCPEMSPCGFWRTFKAWHYRVYNTHVADLTIRERYDAYNKYFAGMREKGPR